MKYLSILAAILITGLGIFAFTSNKNDILEIGATAPKTDVTMAGVSGSEYTLKDLKKENGLLVVFSCNTCPFVVGNPGKDSEGWHGRYNEVHQQAKDAGVGMVLVNSNEAFRDDEDSMLKMQNLAKEHGYTMPYVIDENHVVADAFGALTTPHIYLFDKEMKLVYKGAIDDNVNDSGAVKEHYLRDALQNLEADKKIDPNSTRQLGCSIKRVKK